MQASASANSLANDLETALSGLVKLTKALKIFPAGHPSLVAAEEEAGMAFQPLLSQHAPHPSHVTKDSFNLNATPLAPDNPGLKELAQRLAERQVEQLLFLPELANHELLIFAELLSKPVELLLNQGGLEKQLNDRGIKSIWINEPDLAKILDNQGQWATETTLPQPPAEQGTAAEPRSRIQTSAKAPMRGLLERLKDHLDNDQYAQTLEQVVLLAPDFFEHTGIIGLLTLLKLLEAQRQEPNRNSEQQAAAEAATAQLLNPKIIQQLVNAVADQQLKDSQRRALTRLLVGLQMKVAPALLERLCVERDAIVRRLYSSILAQQGTTSFKLLETALNDPEWYVVRNAVTVLGESHLEAALPLLEKALKHPEVRVRRSVIRALGAIGSSRAIPSLVQLSRDRQHELHEPAIMALGALGDPEAIAPLNEILRKPDPWGKKTLLKLEVIKALAATRSPQAIIPLLKLARRPNRMQRKNLERLRAEAILSLGQLGNKHLLPVLERLPKSDKGPVSIALKQATAQLTKAE